MSSLLLMDYHKIKDLSHLFSLSSAFTHMAIWPLSDPTRNPFLNDLIALTPSPSRSLNAQFIYYLTSFSCIMKTSPLSLA